METGVNYGARVWDKVPSSYTNTIGSLTEAMLNAGVKDLVPRSTVWDVMSGPGLLTGEVLKSRPDLKVVLIDRVGELLAQAQEKFGDSVSIFRRDVREGFEGIEIKSDVALVRYGLKDLGRQSLPLVLQSLKENCPRLVVGDMTANNAEDAKMFTDIHLEKQRLGGRDIRPLNEGGDGECYIPCTAEWIQLLHEAGYNPSTIRNEWNGLSVVPTQKWVESHQVKPEDIIGMNKFILKTVGRKRFERFGVEILKRDSYRNPLNVGISFPIGVFRANSN